MQRVCYSILVTGHFTRTKKGNDNMLIELKWMLIEFLIRHNVLAVERVRVQERRNRRA